MPKDIAILTSMFPARERAFMPSAAAWEVFVRVLSAIVFPFALATISFALSEVPIIVLINAV